MEIDYTYKVMEIGSIFFIPIDSDSFGDWIGFNDV